ncbi:MAG: MFS transporter, partial [Micromonosporaceae bacterium]|nr:MFS transporter [Micromonosporaceae bacterium]
RYGRPLVAAGLALVAAGLAVCVLVLHFVPGRGAPVALVAPLVIAGAGSGLVIAPNQTLTLAEVPVARAGSAAGVLQTGQRIGAAIGIAGVGSVFFARLAAGHWSTAFRTALLVAIAFVLVALVAALADTWAARRAGADRRPHRRADRTRAPAPR